MELYIFQPDWWMLDEGEERTEEKWIRSDKVAAELKLNSHNNLKQVFRNGSKTNLRSEIISKTQTSPSKLKTNHQMVKGEQHLVNDT